MLVEEGEAAFLTDTLLTANLVPEGYQWGGRGLCFCSWTNPVVFGSCKGTAMTGNDQSKILALLELIEVLHLTSARPRILPEEY